MSFEWSQFYFPSRIHFDRGSLGEIGRMVKDLGNRAIIVSVQSENTNLSSIDNIKRSLDGHISGSIVYDDLINRPNFAELDTAAHFTKQSKADIIVAVGSMHTFNTARAMAILSTNEVFAADLPSTALPLKRNPLPIVNVPLIPSMGEETSCMMTAYDAPGNTLIQIRDYRLFPNLVVIDPALNTTAPESEMGRASAAAIASSIESILTKASNEITSTISLRALSLISQNIMIYSKDHGNTTARNNMCMASLLAGMAQNSSGLGICYALSTAISSLTELNFYLAMGILLPHVMDFNLTVSAGRYIQISRSLDEDIKDITVIEAAIKAVEGVRKIYTELNLPQRLSDFEIRKADLRSIADLAMGLAVIKNAMRDVDRSELETILISAY